MAVTPATRSEQPGERDGPEIAAQPVYRGAITVGLLALAAFVAVGLLVASGTSQTLDNAILATLHRIASPPVVGAARAISMLGSEAIALLLPLSALILWLRKHRWQATELVVAALGAQVSNDLLKMVFHRARPSGYSIVSNIPGQEYSFPSGHAMVSIAFYGTLAYVGWRLLRGRRRSIWIAAMVGMVLLIGLARLILEAHYPTDVLASWAAGLIWVDITLVSLGYLHQRRSEHARLNVDPPATAP